MRIDNLPWKPEPDYTRLLRALQRKGDPCDVPFLELFADQEVIAYALDEPIVPPDVQMDDRQMLERVVDQKIRFWYHLGYDAFWQGPLVNFHDPHLESEDTADVRKTKRLWVNEKVGIITSMADFDRYRWPDPADVDYYPLEYAARHLPDGMAIIPQIMGTLEHVMWLMGYETFAMAIYEQPELIEAMFSKMRELSIPVARALVQSDRVVALWMGDDMGFKTATMVAPKHLREYVFPIQKEIAAIAHAQGIPFILHSCGNLESIMGDLIDDVKIDAKHSFEDVIQPVESFVAQYGGQVAVIGGVDVDLLARGTEEQIRARTRQILTRCAPGGGYILGSGNTFANYIPLQNFLCMLHEGWRYNHQ
ncbi:MAG: uroporphyrinogen-III decarboxylase-like protein [Chloroflexi bacterium]|nr:uroporphyrinogen-III decarboxylase-like protein [Chloroflexota bacterium]